MSPISLALNLLVVVLLLTTLGYGMKLERRLKALRDSQTSFALAIADLDRAGQRAETGLAELRGAAEETLDVLLSRIEKARELANKLENLTVSGAAVVDRAQAVQPARSALEKSWMRPAGARTVDQAEEVAEALVLKLTRDAIIPDAAARPSSPRPPPGSPAPWPTLRSRAAIDDDLFDSAPLARRVRP